MQRDEIFKRVQAVTSGLLKVPAERVQPQARLLEDLDVDSLFITQLALALEEEFDIMVSDEDMPRLTTVDAVVDYVAQKIREV